MDPSFVESSIYSLKHIVVPLLDSLMLTRALRFFNVWIFWLKHWNVEGFSLFIGFCLLFGSVYQVSVRCQFFLSSLSLSSAVGLSMFHPLTGV